jgi:hypothetical protein
VYLPNLRIPYRGGCGSNAPQRFQLIVVWKPKHTMDGYPVQMQGNNAIYNDISYVSGSLRLVGQHLSDFFHELRPALGSAMFL